MNLQESMSGSRAELEQLLPNGFHDAQLRALSVDYVASTATIDLDPDVSDVESVDGTIVYRRGRLSLEGLGYLVVEPPRSDRPLGRAGHPRGIDVCETPDDVVVPPVRQGAFAVSIFVSDWNAFIRFEARGARFEWLE